MKYIPPSLRHQVVELKNLFWGGYKEVTYAHCGEDVIIDYFFFHQKKGFYVDVGAHHPKRYSNTARLYARGWRGINIDPDSSLIKVFDRQRKHDINVNVGVAKVSGALTLHRFSDPAVNTFSEENAARLRSHKWLSEIATETIKVRPLREILDEHLPADTTIDFLNIDVEDLDFEVVQSNDWVKYHPTLVAIEDRFFDLLAPTDSQIYNFFTQNGYVFMGYAGLTHLFVDRRHLEAQKQARTQT